MRPTITTDYFRPTSVDFFGIALTQIAIGLFELLSIYAMYTLATQLSSLNMNSFADAFEQNDLILNGALVAALYFSKLDFTISRISLFLRKIFCQLA